MPDRKNLPHLLKLLEDDSPVVREAVGRELAAFGPALQDELSKLDPPPPPYQRRAVREFLAERRRNALREAWTPWLDQPDGPGKLESALGLLSEYLSAVPASRLGALLDGLANDYRAAHDEPEAGRLADFLFRRIGLKGAVTDYYNPLNSDLVYVVEEKRGLPISLACVYILVGRRLGLEIGGCNLPGHFMARIEREGHTVLVDCFDGGRMIEEGAFADLAETSSLESLGETVRKSADTETIVARVLANLINAYQSGGGEEEAHFIAELQEQLESRRGGSA
ncbi:MAG TPA: transglutaminase-like domain-containing protein [Candidatus Eisenbacteria bacterium]|jgi:hypothetical protein|nr:transglutaminase-like domain-containing protein [Candidatus Eisenbacteria bacterium]